MFAPLEHRNTANREWRYLYEKAVTVIPSVKKVDQRIRVSAVGFLILALTIAWMSGTLAFILGLIGIVLILTILIGLIRSTL